MLNYTVWEIISSFGSIELWIAVSLACIILLFALPRNSKKYFMWFVFLVIPSVIIADTITHGAKLILQIPRPCDGLPGCPSGYSMPSGHAVVAFAIATVLGLYYKKKAYLIPSLILAAFVGMSRVILGLHTIPDIVAGSFIGIIVGFIVQKMYKTYYKKFQKLKLLQ